MAASIIHTDFIRKHPAQTVLTLLALSGVGAVFLPFYRTYVPLEVLADPPLDDLFIRLFVGPFVVLPFFIFTGYLRWLLTGRLSRWESGLGYTLALIGALGLPVGIIDDWTQPSSLGEWLVLFSFLVVYAANTWFITQSRSGDTSPAPPALAAMQIVYLVFALFWLTALAIDVPLDHVGSGAYLALVTVLAYTAQAALLVRGQRWKLLRLIPLALVWVLWVLLASIG